MKIYPSQRDRRIFMETRIKMLFLELIAALFVALILSGVFALATRRGRRKTGFFWLFLIIFLATWAGGIWIRPFGPILWGIHWLAFLLIGLVMALVLALSATDKFPRGRHETLNMLERIEQEKEVEKITYVTLSIFFWILVTVLIVAIIFRYF